MTQIARAGLLLAVLCAGCGAGAKPTSPPPPPPPLLHLEGPLLRSLGGPVLAHPAVSVVSFAGDDAGLLAAAGVFVGALGTSDAWTQMVGEYGVGALALLPPVALAEAAPTSTDLAAIGAWLAGKLDAADPAFPAPLEGRVYLVLYPSGASFTAPGAIGPEASCTTFTWRHGEAPLAGGGSVPFVAVARCSTAIAALTRDLSQALVDTATNPFPESAPAWAQPEDAHLSWLAAVGGGEASSICRRGYMGPSTADTGFGAVGRTWSNAALLAGRDPCVPETAGEPFFIAVASQPDLLAMVARSGTVDVRGARIPVGGSRTIELDLSSNLEATGPWQVQVTDFLATQGQPAALSFALSSRTGSTGDRLQLTITCRGVPAGGMALFQVKSLLPSGAFHVWLGAVGP